MKARVAIVIEATEQRLGDLFAAVEQALDAGAIQHAVEDSGYAIVITGAYRDEVIA